MAGLWANWPHTAISISSQSGGWTYSFDVADLVGGLVTGAALGASPAQDLSLIRAGLRIVPRLPGAAFNAGYAVSVVEGRGRGNYTLPLVYSTDTEYHIHYFLGQVYYTRGSGTITADDGLTSLAGTTLIAKRPSGFSGMTRLLAGFQSPSDSIDGYSWDALSATAPSAITSNTDLDSLTPDQTVAYRINAGTAGGDIVITLPTSPARGDTVSITVDGAGTVTVTPGTVESTGGGTPGADTIDGGAAGVDVDDGETIDLTFNGVTWEVVNLGTGGTEVTGGTAVTGDTELDDATPDTVDNIVVVVDGSGGAVTITLPGAPGLGDTITITADGDDVTVDGDGADIDGSASDYTITDGDTAVLQWDGTEWVVVETGTTGTVAIPTAAFATQLRLRLGTNAPGGVAEVDDPPPGGGGILTPGGLTAASAYASLSIPLQLTAIEGIEATEVNYVYSAMRLEQGGSLFDNSVRGTMNMRISALGAEDEFGIMGFMSMGGMTVSAVASGFGFLAPYFDISYPTAFSSSPALTESDVAEEISTGGSVHENYAMAVRDVVQAMSLPQTFWQTSALVSESIMVAQLADLRLALGLADEVSGVDAVVSSFAIAMVEALQVAVGTETAYQAVVAVEELLRGVDMAVWARSESIPEEIDTSDELVALLKLAALVADEVEVQEAVGIALTIVVNEALGMEVSDGVDLLGHYLANVSEQPGVWVGFKLGDEAFTGWVMNTEGNQPISEYTDYPFNSFCELGGAYYGAAEDGLYLLDGTDDAGDPINASVKTMMTDFNSSKMKRVPTGYIGYTTDGKMVLRVSAVSGGELREYWFTATERTANAPREQVIQLGRGIRSRYWQFELANIGGADFEIDKLELYPVYLNRRV